MNCWYLPCFQCKLHKLPMLDPHQLSWHPKALQWFWIHYFQSPPLCCICRKKNVGKNISIKKICFLTWGLRSPWHNQIPLNWPPKRLAKRLTFVFEVTVSCPHSGSQPSVLFHFPWHQETFAKVPVWPADCIKIRLEELQLYLELKRNLLKKKFSQ